MFVCVSIYETECLCVTIRKKLPRNLMMTISFRCDCLNCEKRRECREYNKRERKKTKRRGNREHTHTDIHRHTVITRGVVYFVWQPVYAKQQNAINIQIALYLPHCGWVSCKANSRQNKLFAKLAERSVILKKGGRYKVETTTTERYPLYVSNLNYF